MSMHDVVTGKVTPIEELQREIARLYRSGGRTEMLDSTVQTLAQYHTNPLFQFGGHRAAVCASPYCPICEATL